MRHFPSRPFGLRAPLGVRGGVGGTSGSVPQFALVAEGEDPNLLAQRHEAVQCHEPRCTERNHQFADIVVDTLTDQRMFGEQRDSRRYRAHGPSRRGRVLVPDEVEGLFEVIEGAAPIDYRRHGFGRAARGVFTSRCIQACTSSAR